MPSSSSPSGQRRRPLKKRQPLTRSNSSLFGTIRNIVTAPLTWFSSTDDFEDSKDLKGKRRRAVVPQSAPLGDHDAWSTPNKRMRVHSPPRDHQQLHHHPSGSSYGHLDPPISVFQQQHNQPNFFNQPTTTNSASVSIPVPTMQAYEPVRNNPIIRDSTLSRTMSIDPPSRPVSRSSAMAPIPSSLNSFDSSVESSATLTRQRMRDLSMPPLSARPSFLMRASMTPQPHPQKEASEPPSLSTLVINPVFVRGPSAHETEHHQPSATLGSLVDSVRSTRSPVRQHSSLLFATNVENTNSHRQQSPAEKALHELEVYKTPLLPTRLRSNAPGSSSMIDDSTSTDLFKSRRKSSLVLMHDDERVSRLGRKSNSKRDAPVVNGTKPYAGEGGMKKLLARRRIEAEKHEHGGEPYGSDGAEETVQARKPDGASHARSTLNDGSDEIHMSVYSVQPSSHSLPSSKDWYSTSSTSTPASMSSLRVGRTKTRAHISRPIARPMKTKFSAAYEDDDSMDGTEILRDESEKQLEREMLDEAAKRAPPFNISESFSFAKETNVLEPDSTNAKEPPISSLPFSFTKTNTLHQPNDLQQARLLGSLSAPPVLVDVDSSRLLAASSSAIPVPWGSSPAPAIEDRPPIPPAVEDLSKLSTPPEADPVIDGVNERVIPNFFASSSAFTKPLEVARPPILTFPSLPVSATPNPSSSIGFSDIPAAIAPLKDAENPLWEGESDKGDYAKPATRWNGSGGANNIPPENTKLPVFGTNSPSMSAAHFASHAPDNLVSEGDVNTQKPDDAVAARDSMFDTPTFSLPKLPQVPPSTLFGAPSTSGPSDARSTKQAAPSLFNFGEPGSSVTTSNESPKPLMGGTNETSAVVNPLLSANGFSFGNSASTNHGAPRPPTTPFSFGAAPSTPPPADTKKSLPFSFKDSAASPASAPDAFSFSSDGRNVNGITTKPFSSFGTPVTIAQTDRPTTPPRHDDQEVRMEESPTRELQSTANGKPVVGGGGFSFGAAPGPGFGGQPNATHVSSPFAFGTSASPNPFAKDSKPSDSKPFAGFGQATPSTLFTFGQKPVENNEPPRPSSTGSFPFTSAPSSSATGPGPTFAFGGPSNNSIGSLFGQTQPSGSAPSSPSTFNQPSPFSYTTPLPTTTNPFAFGPSQPASPVGGNTSLSLPQPSAPGGFGGGTGGGFGQQLSSPFGTSAPASSGGTLFTIGAAPPASQGARQIRKLPTRRGGAKR